ncbi:MAG: hypothetical protein K5871_07420 [Lachnospiraceae bacterium]|nr:hypothetical protein [Lachnospiraceae bacterium]
MSDPIEKNPSGKNIFVSAWAYLKEQDTLIRDLMDSFALLVLALYPFRNIHHGLDLWDTGYNYSNFEYMGTTGVDPMWLFSTYLSNAIGHLMSLLPYGHTVLGMNFYTAFVPAVMAVSMYIFFTRHLKYPGWIAFIAEFAALSMCWAPTASLYHYLTYLIITFSCFLLYRGITENEPLTIALSGGLCGLGVFVRFSNLPQASLVIAIWMYGFFEFREAFIKSEGMKKPSRVECLGRTFRRFFWFVIGYIVCFLVFFVYLGIRYGFADYINGIAELFTISDKASGYSTYEMLYKLAKSYFDQLYWVSRLMVFAVAGSGLYTFASWLNVRIGKPAFKKFGSEKSVSLLVVLTRILAVLLAADAICFLQIRKNPFVTYDYRQYWCVFALAGMMCFIALVTNSLPVFFRRMKAGDRLLAVLAAYALLISAIGGNNGSYSSFNNMFFWLPVTFKVLYDLIREQKNTWLYGLKCVLVGVVAFFLVQSTLFGMNFTFTETYYGAAEPRDYIVEYNRALGGIRMSYEKAYCFERLSQHIEANNLSERELINFGQIAGMPFYLQMTPAFNPWPDLASYSIEKMSERLDEIAEKTDLQSGGAEVGRYYERPLIVLCVSDNAAYSLDQDKWDLLYDFIEKEGYELTYEDSMFAVYE